MAVTSQLGCGNASRSGVANEAFMLVGTSTTTPSEGPSRSGLKPGAFDHVRERLDDRVRAGQGRPETINAPTTASGARKITRRTAVRSTTCTSTAMLAQHSSAQLNGDERRYQSYRICRCEGDSQLAARYRLSASRTTSLTARS